MSVLPHVNATRENQLSRRVKEVEEELKLLKIENEKQVCRKRYTSRE